MSAKHDALLQTQTFATTWTSGDPGHKLPPYPPTGLWPTTDLIVTSLQEAKESHAVPP